jgi:putative endopeptidase
MKHRKTRRQKRIQVPPPNPRLRPGADFYRYVNQPWFESLKVPSFISSYGVSEEIEEQIQKKIRKIVEICLERSRKPVEKSEDSFEKIERCLGDLANSILKTSAQSASVQSFQEFLQGFRCIRDKEDVARTMGILARMRVGNLLVIKGKYQEGRTALYHLSLEPGKLGLPDVSYYEMTAPGKSRTLLQYSNLLKQVGKLLNIPEISSVVLLESELAPILSKSKKEDEVEMKGIQLQKGWPSIPWNSLFQGFGLSEWKYQVFLVRTKTWISTLENLFKKTTLETWRLIFSHNTILAYLPYLPPPFDDIHFEFYRKRLKGQAEKTPQYILCLEVLEDWTTPLISRLYVRDFLNPDIKKEVTEFAKRIQRAAKERLKHTEWFELQTREKAIKKIEEMDFSIAYPDSFGQLPIPSMQPGNFFQNLVILGEWETENQIRRLGEKQENQKDWDDPVFAVNAYYYSETNEIVLPAGTLNWPFYGLKSSFGWNYGGLGAIIGHEMTHAFDEDGKNYNPQGEKKSWWSSRDQKHYKEKTKDLVELFNQQTILGHPVSGMLTLSENISDLGGLQIAKQALENHIKQANFSKKEREEALRDFFIAYAVSWRVKEKPAKMIQSLFLDNHAPPSLRVNLVVSQIQEWYDIFDIKEKDPLYRKPEERITIF